MLFVLLNEHVAANRLTG